MPKTQTVVEILYFPGCPGRAPMHEAIREALEAEGMEAAVSETVVEDDLRARELPGFAGSPTVLINGRDPFPGEDAGALSCRVYATPEGLGNHPTVEMLRGALKENI